MVEAAEFLSVANTGTWLGGLCAYGTASCKPRTD